MRPAVRITINGVEVSAKGMQLLESVTITSAAGGLADTCEIIIDNRDGFSTRIGAEIEVWLGYEPAPVSRGRFKVDSWRKDGPPKRLSISAKAADLTAALRVPKMRSYHNLTIAEIVGQIAARNALSSILDATLGSRLIPHIDQQGESDMAFLSRLAKRNGAIFKVADGKLLFADAGSRQLASGAAKSPVALTPADISSWEVCRSERGSYEAASATYMDHEGRQRQSSVVGAGSLRHRDRRLYGSKEEASAAAAANLAELKRGQLTASLTGPGDPRIYASGLVSLIGFDSDADGLYLVRSATHSFSGGGYLLETQLEAQGQGAPSA